MRRRRPGLRIGVQQRSPSGYSACVPPNPATQEAISISTLLWELGFERPSVKIGIDNSAAISFAENATTSPRAKHIDIRYHFTRDCVLSGMVVPVWIPSDTNVADCFTKALPEGIFVDHRYVLVKCEVSH